MKQKWTLELCKEEALKFKSRSEWGEKSRSSYCAAHKNGWLDQCAQHIPIKKIKWTIEECKKDALKYDSISDWVKNSASAYSLARQRNWLGDCCGHMKRIKKEHEIWTLENCKIEALKYNLRSLWQKNSTSSYNWARKNGYLEVCCSHMTVIVNKWTKDNCLNDCQKYSSISEWSQNSSGAYESARKNNWLNNCTKHMKTRKELLQKTRVRTLESCKFDAKKYLTKESWRQNSYPSWVAAYRNGWVHECCIHMKEIVNPIEKKETRPKYIKLFQKYNLKFKEEFYLGKKKIDFVILINGEKIGIEVKHDKKITLTQKNK